MSLKIRRGLEADRTLITPSVGEFLYTTDTKQVYIGDGSTPGGNSLTATAAWGDITGTITAQTDLTLYLSTNYYPIPTGTTSQYIRGDGSLSTFPTIPTVGTWGALNYPIWTTGTPFVKMTAAGTFALDTNTYLTSITSSDVTTALGYTPVTNARTLTINGVTYDLSADRTWTISTGSTPVKLTSQTLTVASWTLVSGYYTYAFSNVNVDITCDVSVTPQNSSYLTAYNAQVLPFVGVAAGVATFYSQFPPQADMVVDIVITQTA